MGYHVDDYFEDKIQPFLKYLVTELDKVDPDQDYSYDTFKSELKLFMEKEDSDFNYNLNQFKMDVIKILLDLDYRSISYIMREVFNNLDDESDLRKLEYKQDGSIINIDYEHPDLYKEDL